ncbi:MAG: formyltetrahydrofolate deformylase [Deltaproteobacteria bacterium]|nr:formyltetrahydrofolate deformylase [Deltaproteobacteria bacterium]
MENSAILLIHCPDTKGIVVSVTEFIYKNNGNITYLDQHVDDVNNTFFMRIEWTLEDFSIPPEKTGDYFQTLIASPFSMKWRLYFSHHIPRMAIFVSKLPHCLYDLLSRWKAGELRVHIPLIISNHKDLEEIACQFGIDFYAIPMDSKNKQKREEEQLELLKKHKADFIVLARYMQILSSDFVDCYRNKIINIHHSFLPAFPGAKPYHSAHERGVKVIGATCHYVTSELDAGPIIEQDVTRVSHTDSVDDMVRKGRDLEKIVLSRGVWHHVQRKTLVYDNRTIIFT